MTASLRSDAPWDVADGLHPDQHAVAFSADGKLAFVGVRRRRGARRRRRTRSTAAARATSAAVEDRAGPVSTASELLSRHPERDHAAQRRTGRPAVPVAVVQPAQPGRASSWAARRTTARGLSPARRRGSRASAATAASPASTSPTRPSATTTTTTRRRRSTTTATTRAPGWTSTTRCRRRDEARSFYTPFEADPVTGGRVFTGLEHVWRTDDNGGRRRRWRRAATRCTSIPAAAPCGDWAPIGQNLTADRVRRPRRASSSSRSSGRRATAARCGPPRAPGACS